MSTPEVCTYFDAVARLRQLGRVYTGTPDDAMFMAIQDAYRRFANEHSWSFLTKQGRIAIQAAQTTGSVAFDRTGGATCERQLTLTGATWPSDIQDWAIQFDDIVCEVEQRHSDTVVQLDAVLCPPADVAAGTSYTAFPRWYPLPNDFAAMVSVMEETSCLSGSYVSPTAMEELMRWAFQTGDAYYWTIRSAPGLIGSYGLFLHGASTATETLDIMYRRRLRPLRYHGEAAADSVGTIAVTAGSTTVTGTGTSFGSTHVGSLFLIGDDATNAPTGWVGDYPYVEKRAVRSVASATSLTLDGNVVTSRSGVKYRITDPIDLPIDVCPAFLKCCEAEYARLARLEERKELETAYLHEVQRAKGADCRVFQRRVVGGPRRVRTRLAHGTILDAEY